MDKRQTQWYLKYRPETLEEMALEDHHLKFFSKMVSSNEPMSVLLSGSAGIGKTTLAKVLVNEIDAEYLFLNCSGRDRGIDTVKNKITNFATTMSLDGKRKIIIADECLEENETVRVGTPDKWIAIPLNELPKDEDIPIVSYNLVSGKFEADIGRIISNKIDMVYEVELENGNILRVTDNHPFIVKDYHGENVEVRIVDGNLIGANVVIDDNKND